jgi:hypothetical protein
VANKHNPYYTGPAADPTEEPTPTELQAWLRGREAWVNDRLSATWEGLVKALDAKLEPVTKQLSELQLQADATARRVDDLTRHLKSHVVADQPHSLTSYPIPRIRQVEDTVRSLSRDFTHHLDLHEGLDSSEGPDVSAEGPDLDMIKYSKLLREAYRTFMRYAADPTVTRKQFDLAVHEFRKSVFELTSWMRTAVNNREGQGAQAT